MILGLVLVAAVPALASSELVSAQDASVSPSLVSPPTATALSAPLSAAPDFEPLAPLAFLSPIPEPSGIVTLAGLFALVLASFIRRRD